jgi:hypothetical protein
LIIGFNFENNAAIVVTYLGHLLDGNLVTDLLSIGGLTPRTGPPPPPPAHAGGLNVHGTFEGEFYAMSGSTFTRYFASWY